MSFSPFRELELRAERMCESVDTFSAHLRHAERLSGLDLVSTCFTAPA